MSEGLLWYRQPADHYMNGLPIGTGRLAAMVLGGIETERIALNHEWLWRGQNRCRDTEPRADRLPDVRQALLAGDYEGGTLKGNQAFGSLAGKRESSNRVDPYQPAGDLRLAVAHAPQVTDYRRQLDLRTGLITIQYKAGGVEYRRDVPRRERAGRQRREDAVHRVPERERERVRGPDGYSWIVRQLQRRYGRRLDL